MRASEDHVVGAVGETRHELLGPSVDDVDRVLSPVADVDQTIGREGREPRFTLEQNGLDHRQRLGADYSHLAGAVAIAYAARLRRRRSHHQQESCARDRGDDARCTDEARWLRSSGRSRAKDRHRVSPPPSG